MKHKDYKKFCEVVHPMKYTGNGISYVIARGNYLGFRFLVMNCRGQHPCAYVDAKGTKYDGKDYDGLNIECHEGLTYSDKESPLTGEIGWWLGWDYAHYGDRVEYGNPKLNAMHCCGKKTKTWKTADAIDECMNVIEQISGSARA